MNPASLTVSFPAGMFQAISVPLYNVMGLAPLTTQLLSQNRFEDLHVALQQGGLPSRHLAESARQLTIGYGLSSPEGLDPEMMETALKGFEKYLSRGPDPDLSRVARLRRMLVETIITERYPRLRNPHFAREVPLFADHIIQHYHRNRAGAEGVHDLRPASIAPEEIFSEILRTYSAPIEPSFRQS